MELMVETELESLTPQQAKEELRFCDSYSRLPTLLDLAPVMNDGEWLRLLGELWSICDNIGVYVSDLWDSPLCSRQGMIPEMMTMDEQAAYDALPDTLTVYRGCYTNNKWGFSWSRSRELARGFPLLWRYRQKDEQAILVTAQASKENIIAVKLDRDEQEIITWQPKHISTRHIKVP